MTAVDKRYLIRIAIGKSLATLATLQWSVTCVQLHDVVLEVRLAATRRRTQLTLKHRLLTGVYQLVSLQTNNRTLSLELTSIGNIHLDDLV